MDSHTTSQGACQAFKALPMLGVAWLLRFIFDKNEPDASLYCVK
jgi:hypothetical protein